MEKYLNMPIKEVITKFPKVADILNKYNIGCVPCNVGSCLLKDIVDIHNLSQEDERNLLAKIAQVIYPGRQVKLPELKRRPRTSKEIKYSPPIKRLVDEHTVIKKWVNLIPTALENLNIESASGRQLILDGIDFIRLYADKFHHAKEEDILFGYTDKNLDIIRTMLQDHDSARGHVKAVLEAIKNKDAKGVIEHLSAYKDLLTEHIKKEDEILYPWIDRALSTSQVGELFTKFDEREEKMDMEVIEKCKRFADEAEERIQKLRQKKKEVAR